jgi:two-component system sensor histidine kinase QseC
MTLWFDGVAVHADTDSIALPLRDDADGFVDLVLDGRAWRVFYLREPGERPRRIAAVAQSIAERDEIAANLLVSQGLPWLAMLPVMLAALAWAARVALAPLRGLTRDVGQRDANDLSPIRTETVALDLRPLVSSMNRLFGRIDDAIRQERRFTADAAHELRTPIAAVRAQWDAVCLAATPQDRARAADGVGRSLDRLERLAAQMLSMARADTAAALPARPIDWRAAIAEAVDDTLPLIEARDARLEVEWPTSPIEPLPLTGDPGLVATLLRNLLDNAVRYGPSGAEVTIRLAADRVVVEDRGPGIDEAHRSRLGERFHRPDGSRAPGTGLGVSIALRVAALHGLSLAFDGRDDGPGLRVTLARPAPGPDRRTPAA